ncbi:hypothetical protein ABC974_25640 [Sphingomonas oligophenolica]|uniref:DUF1453 family protein n=1 Tax=Sphingomonas oligophenolica TaxID=301154 RepID=A0ABU9YB41_9SPHN
MPGLIGPVLGFAALGLMRRRLSRERRLKLARQWGLLGLSLSITALAFCLARPLPLIWLWSVPATAAGALLGGVRARTIILSLDDTGRVMQRLPANAFGLLLLILSIRPVVRWMFTQEIGANVAHSDLVVLAFALGTVAGGRIELTARALRLRRQVAPASYRMSDA